MTLELRLEGGRSLTSREAASEKVKNPRQGWQDPQKGGGSLSWHGEQLGFCSNAFEGLDLHFKRISLAAAQRVDCAGEEKAGRSSSNLQR
jgi:hypothetical protein